MNRLKANFYLYTFFISVAFERAVFVLFLDGSGVTGGQISTLQISLFLSNLIAEVPTGRIGDRFGKRFSLICGCVLMGIAILLQFQAVQVFPLLMLGFILHGIAFAFVSGSGEALLYENLLHFNREDLYLGTTSRAKTVGSLALGGSMFLGGYLESLSWGWVYYSTVSFNLFAIVPLIFLKEPSICDQLEDSTITSLSTLSEIKGFLPFVLPVAFLHGAATPFFIFGQKLFDDKGFAIFVISSFIAATEVIGAFLSVPLSQWISRFKLRSVIFLSCILMMGFQLTALSDTAFLFVGGFFLANLLALTLLNVSTDYFQKKITNHKRRASILSSITFFDSFAIGLGYVFYGVISPHFTMSQVIALAALFPLVALLNLLIARLFSRENFHGSN